MYFFYIKISIYLYTLTLRFSRIYLLFIIITIIIMMTTIIMMMMSSHKGGCAFLKQDDEEQIKLQIILVFHSSNFVFAPKQTGSGRASAFYVGHKMALSDLPLALASRTNTNVWSAPIGKHTHTHTERQVWAAVTFSILDIMLSGLRRLSIYSFIDIFSF